MSTPNERVSEIRKSKSLTTEEFGLRLGVSRAAISNIENGKRSLTYQMLKSICREFGVSEDWLKYGEGEMFGDLLDDAVARFSRENGLGRLEEVLIRGYLDLSEDGREVFRQYIHKVAAELLTMPATDPDEREPTIDEKVAAYRAELEAEEASKKSQASQTTEGDVKGKEA